MKIDTALRYKSRAKTQVKDLYSMACITHMTSEQINTRYLEINASLRKCPEWVRSYLEGVRDILNDDLYSEHLEYCSYLPDGRLASHYSGSPRYYQKLGVSPSQLSDFGKSGGHYWKGTDKPFFVG